MSHTVKVKSVQITDVSCLEAAIERLGLAKGEQGTHRLFDGTTRKGVAIKLPNWKFPVVIDTEKGEALFDNYNGAWGQEIEIDRLVQAYTVEKTSALAREQGFTDIVNEVDEQGAVHLTASAYDG
jgi:hypothetical protein